MDSGGTAKSTDFEYLEEIGKGAYGTVYKAKYKKNNQLVAVKVITLEQDWLPLLAEVNMVIDLRHDTIVNYYHWFFEGGALYLVMEYCDGGSLSDIIQTLRRPLTEQELSSVLRGVLKGLIYVHSLNRIHRDIKSGNLLLTSDGLVKLCDFGVSAQLDDTISKTGTRIGSPYWMAPEVILSQGHNTKADIWSFGITALELFMGKPPLSELPPLMAMMKIPQQEPPSPPGNASQLFKNFIKKTLVKDPEQRPSASDLLKDPFITQIPERNSTEIIRNLVSSYMQAKKNPEDEYEEEEEEEEEEDFSDAPQFSPDDVKTILFKDNNPAAAGSDGTFIPCEESGTMIIQSQGKQGNQLSQWKPEFIEQTKGANKGVQQAQKRHFKNFSEPALLVMLQSVKDLALRELKEGKIAAAAVRENYEEVRRGIVSELQKRKSKDAYPDEYEVLA